MPTMVSIADKASHAASELTIALRERDVVEDPQELTDYNAAFLALRLIRAAEATLREVNHEKLNDIMNEAESLGDRLADIVK